MTGRNRLLTITLLLALFVVDFPAEGEQKTPASPPRFTDRLIHGDYGYAFGLAAADLDGDGDLDLTGSDVRQGLWLQAAFERRFTTDSTVRRNPIAK